MKLILGIRGEASTRNPLWRILRKVIQEEGAEREEEDLEVKEGEWLQEEEDSGAGLALGEGEEENFKKGKDTQLQVEGGVVSEVKADHIEEEEAIILEERGEYFEEIIEEDGMDIITISPPTTSTNRRPPLILVKVMKNQNIGEIKALTDNPILKLK